MKQRTILASLAVSLMLFCGCGKANGDCELMDAECVFSKRLRIADSRIDYSSLEEGAVPPVEERP